MASSNFHNLLGRRELANPGWINLHGNALSAQCPPFATRGVKLLACLRRGADAAAERGLVVWTPPNLEASIHRDVIWTV